MVFDWKDKVLFWCSAACALCAVLVLLALYVFIAGEGLPIWRETGVCNILFRADWQPLGSPARVGLFTMLASTLWSSLGAMLLAAPLGVFCGILLSEYAPRRLSAILRAVLYVLTGIPSVVYGFVGASVIVPWYERVRGLPSGESLFCASLVLSVMVIPYIVSGTYAAYQAIPRDYREAGYVLGTTQGYITAKILTPLAYRGMVSAITLAFARAAGETMAVLMLAGNTLTMPLSWFSKGEPLSALIALEIGTAEVGSRQYQALFAAGLVLLLFVTFINSSIYYLGNRRRY